MGFLQALAARLQAAVVLFGGPLHKSCCFRCLATLRRASANDTSVLLAFRQECGCSVVAVVRGSGHVVVVSEERILTQSPFLCPCSSFCL